MKKLLAALLAIALPVAADGPVVCSETPQSPGVARSATPVSISDCVCAATAEEAEAEPSVYDDAISLWKLDETSGTRVDSIGSNDLTDNNTVGYVNLGPQGVVADFVAASSEYLDRAATIPRDGTSFTLAFWAYIPDPGAATSRWYVSQGNQTAWISKQNEVMAIDVVGGGEAYATTSMAGMAAGWFFIVAGYNSATGKSFVSVNDGAVSVSAGTSTGVSTDANFQLGRVSGGGAGTVYFDDAMGRIGLWNSVLAASEITSLYNSGLGKSYADLTAAEKVGLVSYWNLDEASGNRADSHGSNTLTDNNTVGSATNSYPANLPGRVANFVAANSEYLSLASDSTLDLNGGDYTFAFWVKFTTLPGELYPLGRDTAGSLTQYLFNSTASSVTFNVQDDPFSVAITASTGGGSVSTGTWYLVVGGIEGSNVFISLDGGAKTTTAITITPATGAATFFLGARRAAYGHMNGQMSAVAVWDRALSADDITALYNSGDGAVLP